MQCQYHVFYGFETSDSFKVRFKIHLIEYIDMISTVMCSTALQIAELYIFYRCTQCVLVLLELYVHK